MESVKGLYGRVPLLRHVRKCNTNTLKVLCFAIGLALLPGPKASAILPSNEIITIREIGSSQLNHQFDSLCNRGGKSAHAIAEIRFRDSQLKITEKLNDLPPTQFYIQCSSGQIIFDPNTRSGRALWLWATAKSILNRAAEFGLLGTQSGQVHFDLLEPDEKRLAIFGTGINPKTFVISVLWKDIVGKQDEMIAHEIGHIIALRNQISPLVSGLHDGTQCNKRMAYSEGLAHFFAAWSYLDVNSPNPELSRFTPGKVPGNYFKFAVSTEIPVRIVNWTDSNGSSQTLELPVKSTCSEFSVLTFLWDLVDRNNDGEQVQLSFESIWNALRGKSPTTIEEAAAVLIEQNMITRTDLDQVWRLNFEDQYERAEPATLNLHSTKPARRK